MRQLLIAWMLGLVLPACGQGTTGGSTRAARTAGDSLEAKPGKDFHWRLSTPRGIVHVWRPRNFGPEGAGTVVYVHGYFTSADGAWQEHHLADQFEESQRNAVFIVPEAPAGDDQKVAWENLEELLATVWKETGLAAPPGPLVVVGHSGAFRTLACWLGHPRLTEIVLLDGFYAQEDRFAAWLEKGDTKHKRLILIGSDTAERSEQFIQKYSFAIIREGFPDGKNPPFSDREKRSRLLYVRSQYEHMELVTGGLVIPAILTLSSLSGVAKVRERMPWEK